MPKTRKLLALLSITLCASCSSIVTGPSAKCSELIPGNWAAGIPGADVPETDNVRDWQKGFVQQSVQLEKANGRTADVIHIFGRCEMLVNASQKRRGLF